jgi:site-specific recombinase XerD
MKYPTLLLPKRYIHRNRKNMVEEILERLDISENTKKDYRYRADLFLKHVDTNGLHVNTFVEFKQSLRDMELSVSSKNKYLTTARVLLKELNRIGYMPQDITQNIKSFKCGRLHKKTGVTEEEIEILITRLRSMENTVKTLRLKAMFSLLAFQGLRTIEVVRIELVHMNIAERTVKIISKGKDDFETVYLSPQTVRAIESYIKASGIVKGSLFQNQGCDKGAKLSTRTIQREVEKLFKDCDIEKTVHGLRHYYITSLLGTMDIRDVRKFSRHSNLDQLVVYDDELDLENMKEETFECFSRHQF